MMKTIVLSLMFCSAMLAQQRAESKPWLVDPASVRNSVYALNVGRNPYEALLRSLAGLADKLRMSSSEIQPDRPAALSAVTSYSFGKTTITFQKHSSRTISEKEDSLSFLSTVSFSAKLQFSDKTKKCSITSGGKVLDRADDETFGPSAYRSKTESEQSLSYEFTNMTFSDLLAELEREGVKITFTTEYDVTYSLAAYPLSKVIK
jgi:hypothetical protein